MVRKKKTENTEEVAEKRSAQDIKNILKANEYLYEKYPSLKESIERENEQLKEELKKIEDE